MKNFFYFIKGREYLICDSEFCAKSDRTFDMSFLDLANNEALLGKLKLFYMNGTPFDQPTKEHRMKAFASYISAFNPDNEGVKYEKLLTNPTIRLLVEDDKLLEQVKTILT
jgi:hypothetical protein